jgi:U3 small nucleolar ribonucleoprotein protein LCP5
MSKQGEQEDAESHPESFSRNDSTPTGDGIYRPPRLAPVPYVEKSKSEKRRDRPPVPSALATLSADPSRPHLETTSGLGGIPALASGRASYLKRLKDFEEENFSRLIMKKSDAKRRARDEEDLALGGNLAGGGGRRRAGGLADEFGDVLRSVDRVSGRGQGDGYEELRRKGKKEDVLSRSRRTGGLKRHEEADGGDEPQPRKRSRFELEAKIAKKKLGKRRR